MVMSTAFVRAVKDQYPTANIDLIAKKGIDFLLDHFPAHGQRYIFSKEIFKGISGAWQFGRHIRKQKKYDIFFCLPDSFSSAVMGYAIGATKSAGYKKELRSVLLTHSYPKPKNIHRVEEYTGLLKLFSGQDFSIPAVLLTSSPVIRKNELIININSEAGSRRLPAEKAISLINAIRKKITENITLAGSTREKEFVDRVYDALADKSGISNAAGKTTLPQLVELFASCTVILSTDSGPAHVANALGVYTIVLFGAGNEKNTAPFNKNNRTIFRLGKLPCEPCVNNICKLYAEPECLIRLDEQAIALEVEKILQSNKSKFA